MDTDNTSVTFLTQIIAILETQSELLMEQKEEINKLSKMILDLTERVRNLKGDVDSIDRFAHNATPLVWRLNKALFDN